MKWLRRLLPPLVLALCVGLGVVLIKTGPQAERRQPPPVVPTVDVIVAVPSDYTVRIHTRGTVAPRTESTLIPEVSGRVVRVAPQLRDGGFFEAGDVLLETDPRNYENAVVIARAELASARVNLNEERARAEQALRDWKKLDLAGEPTDLVLRKPQLASAQAAVAAAEARLRQAEIDRERTRIRAPYAGRVLKKSVDVGQYVSPGTVLATVYAVDYVEIRLPLSNTQLEYVDLPEAYRGDTHTDASEAIPVTVRAVIGSEEHRWGGRVVRTEGAIDAQSRQLFVVAQVNDPYARRDQRHPLKVGQFVEAEIEGARLSDVFILPRAVLRGDNEVVVVDDAGRVDRRPVVVAWSDGDNVVIRDGLAAGERVSLTAIPFAVTGSPVKVRNEQPQADMVNSRRGG